MIEFVEKLLGSVVIACMLGIAIVFIISLGFAIWKVIKHRVDNK